MLKIEINRQTGTRLQKKRIEKIIKAVLGKIGVSDAEISVAFVGGQEIKKLNCQYRGKNKVTDVLSFRYQDKPLQGEIIICYPKAAHQAKERGSKTDDEIKLLLVHGLLHIRGYDHEKSLSQAKRMENLQNKIIKSLKI